MRNPCNSGERAETTHAPGRVHGGVVNCGTDDPPLEGGEVASFGTGSKLAGAIPAGEAVRGNGWVAAKPERPQARGKFIWLNGEKLYVKGVTYGTFEPDGHGDEYPPRELVARDFEMMAANGVNAVRTYTVPPLWLLDLAHEHGLLVMVGLAAERYVGYEIDRAGAPDVRELVRASIRGCSGHPAILAYAVANEIPAPTVRWLGRQRAQRLIERLVKVVREEDPGALVTYVTYPSTEYLDLPSLDFVCINVYLEDRDAFEAYVARMQTLSGDRPLVLGEVGLDSSRNGVEVQAHSLDSQVRCAFEGGCAGAFVYAWTDSWYRGGEWVFDWDFGLTERDRTPKPALGVVRRRFATAPVPAPEVLPRFSVVVCSYNGSRTINSCLKNLLALDYPDYEVIVVDDGSTDRTAAIVEQYPVRLLRSPNEGLSSARNRGLKAATGEYVVYLDDDAYPNRMWLRYLELAFRKGDYAAVGGPNIVPPDDEPIAQCVARAPGGPIHVLLSDTEAEHIPGCNMAFERSALLKVGGFDPQFRIAGDDVDLCWRIMDEGWKIGFHPGAMVWHHRRNSVRAYLRQQRNYGRAEAMLERKWPAKYNMAGHVRWAGRVYGPGGLVSVLRMPSRVYHGVFGSAPFQSLNQQPPTMLGSLPAMPEWYLLIAILAGLSALSLAWAPLAAFVPFLALAIAASVVGGIVAAVRQWHTPHGGHKTAWAVAVTAFLHLAQPVARLSGRLGHGLAPWRRRHLGRLALPRRRTFAIWSDEWRSAEERLLELAEEWRSQGATVVAGGPYDRWDLEVRCGLFGIARLLMSTEDHPGGTQLVRVRVFARAPWIALCSFAAASGLAVAAAADGALAVGALFTVIAVALGLSALFETAAAHGVVISRLDGDASTPSAIEVTTTELEPLDLVRTVTPSGLGE